MNPVKIRLILESEKLVHWKNLLSKIRTKEYDVAFNILRSLTNLTQEANEKLKKCFIQDFPKFDSEFYVLNGKEIVYCLKQLIVYFSGNPYKTPSNTLYYDSERLSRQLHRASIKREFEEKKKQQAPATKQGLSLIDPSDKRGRLSLSTGPETPTKMVNTRLGPKPQP